MNDKPITHSKFAPRPPPNFGNRQSPIANPLVPLAPRVHPVLLLLFESGYRNRRDCSLQHLRLETDGSVERIAEAYGMEREDSAYLLPGAMDTLKHFKESGIKLALVSNGMSDGQWRKVKRFNMEPLFDCILIEGDFGTGKPDNRVFRHVLDKLNVKAADAWMVGDNLHFDISGGQAAGLYSIWVDWQDIGLSPTSPVQLDRIVHSITELRDSVK